MTRAFAVSLVVLFSLFVAAQLVPYRATNPEVVQEVGWDTSETSDLARRACYDCHSNEVRVPWYGHVAPVAWVVRRHVDEGRAALNLSEMNRFQEEAHEAGETVQEREMPPAYYVLMHPEARLTAAERARLTSGLNATLGSESEHTDEDSDSDSDSR